MAPSRPTVPRAQDPDELFDVIDAEGRPLGLTRRRADVHRRGDWHRALHVWIYGVHDASPFLLFQRRSMLKDTAPGRLDPTVGGHYGTGETIDDVLREVEEELGVPADLASLRFAGVRVRSSEAEPGIIDREIQDVFLWRRDDSLESYTPDPVELDGLVEVSIDWLLSVFGHGAGSLSTRTLTAATKQVTEVVLRPDEFLPSVDRYPFRVAVAALAALRGDEWIAV